MGILKEIGKIFSPIDYSSSTKETENDEKAFFNEDTKNSINEFSDALGDLFGKKFEHPFQTKKDLEEAERVAKEQERENWRKIAESSGESAKLLAQIANALNQNNNGRNHP